MDTKFGMNVTNRILLNAATWVTAFTIFELLRENQLGGWEEESPPKTHPPRLGLSTRRAFQYQLRC